MLNEEKRFQVASDGHMQFIDGIRWIIDRRGNQRRSDKIIRQGRISKHLATSKFVFEAKRMITLVSNCRYTDMRENYMLKNQRVIIQMIS